MTDINRQNQDLVQKYRKEMLLRKRYLNELIELKGTSVKRTHLQAVQQS